MYSVLARLAMSYRCGERMMIKPLYGVASVTVGGNVDIGQL
jgi:hypothetical protein